MRWRKVTPILLLFALAAFLASVNTWYTAAPHSTIPLALDTNVLGKEIRREKHEGRDDVYLLQLEGLGTMQVDRDVHDHAQVGETLQKGPAVPTASVWG